MTDSKMPERIWVEDNNDTDGGGYWWLDAATNTGLVEYIRADLAHPAPVAAAEFEALVQRAEAIDPVLEVEFDTQMDVERNPYGAREAIEDALYLIRDLSTALRARTAQPVGVRDNLILALLQKHEAEMRAKGRNPVDFTSKWKQAADTLALLPEGVA